MWWIFGWILEVGVAFALLTGVWFIGPAIWSFVGPDFTPISRNDASVFQAQQTAHP